MSDTFSHVCRLWALLYSTPTVRVIWRRKDNSASPEVRRVRRLAGAAWAPPPPLSGLFPDLKRKMSFSIGAPKAFYQY